MENRIKSNGICTGETAAKGTKGTVQTRTVGRKLTPTIRLNTTNIKLRVKTDDSPGKSQRACERRFHPFLDFLQPEYCNGRFQRQDHRKTCRQDQNHSDTQKRQKSVHQCHSAEVHSQNRKDHRSSLFPDHETRSEADPETGSDTTHFPGEDHL